jgi:hypothetical protein
VLAAFAAGLAIFAGCALIYSRVQDSQMPAAASTQVKHPAPVVSVEAPAPSVSLDPPSTIDPPAPAPETPVRTHRTAPASHPDISGSINSVPRPKPQIPDAVLHPWTNTAALARNLPAPAVQLPTPADNARTISLPAGTKLVVRLRETLSSKHNLSGQTFRATLASPLIVNGILVADMGAMVLGRIVDARKAHLMHGHSDLSLVLTDLTTVDRQLVKIQTAQWYEKGSRSKVITTARAATGAAVGAVVGAAAGAARGAGLRNGEKDEGVAADSDPSRKHVSNKRNIVLPARTELEFHLISPVAVPAP